MKSTASKSISLLAVFYLLFGKAAGLPGPWNYDYFFLKIGVVLVIAGSVLYLLKIKTGALVCLLFGIPALMVAGLKEVGETNVHSLLGWPSSHHLGIGVAVSAGGHSSG